MKADTEDAATQARDQFIAVRKSDIVDALVAQSRLDADGREAFGALCRMLGAIYHYEYFDRLERLRADYYYFNPELAPHARCNARQLEESYAGLSAAFEKILKAANFVEVGRDEIERAHREHGEVRVALRAPTDDFREVRFFRRGHRVREIEISEWWGLRRRKIVSDVYDDVVLFVAMKPHDPSSAARDAGRQPRKIRSGSVLIKYFRNIASADLNALYPEVRVVMSLADKLVLGVPAVAGGIPIVLNLIPTLSVLFLVIGFYLGISGAVHDDEMKKALAALSGLVALGGFTMRQWVKYQRQSLRYQKLLTDNVYFRNINNNAGIFDYLIGAAEEQECKEAFLAYYFLHVAGRPLSQTELDGMIERWLQDTFGLQIDFEVVDALGKLERLGLLQSSNGAFSVLPLRPALRQLDRVWDDFFAPETAATQSPA